MPYAIPENIYGHRKRLNWLLAQVTKHDKIVEFGCGTGYMIARPLLLAGYDITGIDLDQASITYGQQIFQREGLPTARLQAVDLAKLEFQPSVIIASEVLEHINDDTLETIFQLFHQKLTDDGQLLVTVPNGFGWSEMEGFLWFKTGLGDWVERLRIGAVIRKTKYFFWRATDIPEPSTVADSPHVQQFTYDSIQQLLQNHGFEVQSRTSSVLFAGPFSNLFFTGIEGIMRFNSVLGDRFPRRACGFYLACRRKKQG